MTNFDELLHHAKIEPLGEAAVQVYFGDKIDPDILKCVSTLKNALEADPLPGFKEVEGAYTGLAIFYDPKALVHLPVTNESSEEAHSFQVIKEHIQNLLSTIKIGTEDAARLVRIPVCYGGEYGPDLEYVAKYHKMTPEEVVKLHTSGNYLVYMIGFAPGFPYVGGLPPEIATPRRETPRTKIPKGSVGIAGSQTGAYPLETPGGWQLIGRTPLALFKEDDEEQPSVLQAGDKLEFYAVTPEEYEEILAREGGK